MSRPDHKDVDRMLDRITQGARDEELFNLDLSHQILQYATGLIVALGFSIAVIPKGAGEDATVVGLVHADVPYDPKKARKLSQNLAHTCTIITNLCTSDEC